MARKVVIIGAGEAGRMVLREITGHAASGLEVVGFLDDESTLAGKTIDGFKVLGSSDNLVETVAKTGAEEAIIAVPSGGRDFVRRIIRLCRNAGIEFKIVPGLIEIIRGPVHLDQIREVHPDDLLGRETVEFDDEAIQAEISGRRIMVTGAGGSIGGEICRQLGQFDLAELLLFGRGENQIYAIEEEMRATFPSLNLKSVIGDIRDKNGLRHIFDKARPDCVYHAAAHKHVHYMERHPEEAVKNNVFGTKNIIDACCEYGVERLVMLSTDKAVQPLGVMGATKRIAEFLMAGGRGAGNESATRCITVRFGNVLGSRGSVVPLFIRQIRAGGPVTVSDPEASRFFMTLKEACMLVVQASVMGNGGEIFVLRMGDPIKITEIARDLVALHGLRPDVDIKIKFTGLREGEKLHEALIVEGESVEDSPHPYILTSYSQPPKDWDPDTVVDRLRSLTEAGDGDGVRKYLGSMIPDGILGND